MISPDSLVCSQCNYMFDMADNPADSCCPMCGSKDYYKYNQYYAVDNTNANRHPVNEGLLVTALVFKCIGAVLSLLFILSIITFFLFIIF